MAGCRRAEVIPYRHSLRLASEPLVSWLPVNNTMLSPHKALPLRRRMQRCPCTIPVPHEGLHPLNRKILFKCIVIYPIGGLRQTLQHQ